MKETESHKHQPEVVKLADEQGVYKWVEIKGKLRPKPGQFIFEFDLENSDFKTGKFVITKAHVEVAALLDGRLKKKLRTRDNCLYAPAINVENSKKHFFYLMQEAAQNKK